ncbi:unnamed protein product [Zymoseptoria tritici ST99CH_1A5]|uniref:Uncharacterized protein n=2 Tax=Zymoseptoria tritici TaxID=1047171 RepID=A0A1X7RKA3_ZYMT9|nr:unnamed protein product [Zymoseptoria tritici ST99CH_3D7]SMR47637.1 unnamed protein product [Zymoseptoria tritici ST99CH_3D1]SMY21541.1 unnamed protein product [Zymoseptoria tritici ST99CH_1A5]
MYPASSSKAFSQRPAFEDVPDVPAPEEALPPDQQQERRLSTNTTTSRRDETRSLNRPSRPASGVSQAALLKNKSASSTQQHPYFAEDFELDDRPHHASRPSESTIARNFSRRPSSNTREPDIDISAFPPPPTQPPRLSTSTRRSQNPTWDNVDKSPPRSSLLPPTSRLPTEIYTISYLVFFSIFGTLARLGTQWITFYPGAPITTPVLWANMAGSLVMGFLTEDINIFLTHHTRHIPIQNGEISPSDRTELMKTKKTIPLYIGLATGFCGSYTSFSSFARDIFLALSNDLPSPISHPYTGATPSPSSTNSRHPGYSVESLLAVILSTLALSIAGFLVGTHLASAVHPYTPSLAPRILKKILNPTILLLGFGCWIGAVLLSIFPPHNKWRGEVLFALVFAPLGCLLRHYTSLLMNPLVPTFPLGTFTVNIFGTAVEAMCYSLQHVGLAGSGLVGGGVIGCQVLQGVQDGFCGCLTTVSTWVGELVGMKRRRSGYVYGTVSVGVALGLVVVIMGSVRWSVGFEDAVCSTGYPNKVHG